MFVLSYEIEKTTPYELHQIAEQIKNFLSDEEIFFLPNYLSLRKCSKEELKYLLEILEKTVKELLDE